MELQAFLEYCNSGKTISGTSEEIRYSGYLTQEALKITAQINGAYAAARAPRRRETRTPGKM